MIKKILWALALASVSPLTLALTPMATCAASECGEDEVAALQQRLYQAATAADEAAFAAYLTQLPPFNAFTHEGKEGLLAQAIIMPPQRPQPVLEEGMDEEETPSLRTLSAEEVAEVKQRFGRELPKREAMLRQALAYGMPPDDYIAADTALMLAVGYGSSQMVADLLAYGANPNAVGERGTEILTLLFDPKNEAFASLGLPLDLVTPAEYSDMVLRLIAAGAHRPYAGFDAEYGEAGHPPYANINDTWSSIVLKTEGVAVMEAMLTLGTQPQSEGFVRALNQAVVSEKLDQVQWLQRQQPREVADWVGADQEDIPHMTDAWLEALMYAVYLPKGPRSDALIRALWQPDMVTSSQMGPRFEVMKAGAPLRKYASTFNQYNQQTLLAHVLRSGRLDWAERLHAQLAEREQQGLLSEAIENQNQALLTRLLAWYPDILTLPEYQTDFLSRHPLAMAIQSESPQLLQQLLHSVTPQRLPLLAEAGSHDWFTLLTERHEPPAGSEAEEDVAYGFGHHKKVLSDRMALRLAKLLMRSGLKADAVPINTIVAAINNQQTGLALYLLDHGAGRSARSPFSPQEMRGHERALYVALSHNALPLAKKILALDLPPELRVELTEPWLSWLMVDPKVSPNTLAFVRAQTGASFANSCLIDPGLRASLSYEPARMAWLRQQGVSFSQGHCLPEGEALVLTWLSDLLSSSLPPLLGGSADHMLGLLQAAVAAGVDVDKPMYDTARLPAVLEDYPMWRPALPEQDTLWSVRQLASFMQRQDVLAILATVAPSPPQLDVAAKRVPMTVAERAQARTVVGQYEWVGGHEGSAVLALEADGRFRYGLMAGALDLYSEGDWWVEGQQLRVVSDPNLQPPPFHLSAATAGRPNEPVSVTLKYSEYLLFDNVFGLSVAGVQAQRSAYSGQAKTKKTANHIVSERYEFDLADEVQGLAVKMRLLHDGHWLAFDPALLQGKRHFTIEVRPEPTLHPIDFSLKIGQERLSDGDGAWAKSSDTP